MIDEATAERAKRKGMPGTCLLSRSIRLSVHTGPFFCDCAATAIAAKVVLNDYSAEATFGRGWSCVVPRRATGWLSSTIACSFNSCDTPIASADSLATRTV